MIQARIEVTPGATAWLIVVTDGRQRIVVGKEYLAVDALNAARLAGRALALPVHHHIETTGAPE